VGTLLYSLIVPCAYVYPAKHSILKVTTTMLKLVTSAMPSQYHSLLEVPNGCESPANKHDSYLESSLGLQDIRVGCCMVACNRLHLAGLETKRRNKARLYRPGAH
jgi:hypothetical protein